MTAAVLVEEELQNSLATSEDDAEFEEEDDLAADALDDHIDDYAANNQLHIGMMQQNEGRESENEDNEEEMAIQEDGEDGSDDEAEDEPDEEESGNGNEDEDDEGVGAVKIAPVDEEDEAVSASDDEEESAASVDEDDESKDSTDVDVEERWEPEAEEEEELTNPNRCIFCQQDEENDPSEEFESYLACGVCGDNAHRQCGRNSNALQSEDESQTWYCPDCVTNNLIPEPVVAEETLESFTRRISRDKIAGDLLPSQRGPIKPDSHSVFNQLIAPDDPLDGSRHLRKRKMSSVEVDHEETKNLRRRNRDRKNASSQSDGPKLEISNQVNDEMDIDQMTGSDRPLTNGDTRKTEPSSPRISRSLRPKTTAAQPINSSVIVERSATALRLRLKIDPVELRHIASQPPKPQKKKKSRPPSRTARSSVPPSTYIPTTFSQPFYSLHDREVDELKSKPYGGILTEEEADTNLTLPKPEHRRQFDEARQKAEEEWKARSAAAADAAAASGLKKARKVSGPASQIEYIEFGQYQIDIWYAAPYPEEYSRNKALFICEFCLKYMESDIVAWRHKTKCPWKHPPGDEIYRDGKVSMFEVDGRKNPLYCQNLCLLAKLFLGSKTLYYDVEPFLFYVMTEYDELGCHFVGYFSKEKRPSSMNNVSCILVLPIHQRKGYGHLLIDFSYLLTRVEKKIGSPEKPLSDMGLVSYRNYWRLVMCYYLKDYRSGDRIPSIRTISNEMGLTPDDVISALDALGALIRDPISGTYAMKVKTDYYREVIRQHESKGYTSLNERALVWTPFVMGRGNASNFEYGPPLNTVAPREEEDDDEGQDGISPIGKRDFENFANGDAEAIVTSLGRLSTELGDSIHVDTPSGSPTKAKANGISRKLSYYEAAVEIPPTRFEVFPPQAGARGRSNPRPPASRSTPNSRPRPNHSNSTRSAARRSSSSRHSSAARPRSANSRRRSGGTGRGPGRWPKGTKKSDFGNADSGPGLPPKTPTSRSRLGHEVTLGEEEESDEDEEMEEEEGDEDEEREEDATEMMYETPAMRKRRNHNEGLGKPPLDGKGPGHHEALGETYFDGEEEQEEEGGDDEDDDDDEEDDEAMEDALDAESEDDPDAEGEEEDEE